MSAVPPRSAPPLSAAVLIRDARERAELTQVQLAQRAGVTQSVISTYENGRREPSLAALQRMLRAAGFTTTIDLQPVEEPPAAPRARGRGPTGPHRDRAAVRWAEPPDLRQRRPR
ncbi:helix-turn-helix transcriptional regulator [Curtobacterium flaccumfaciens pv. flaccumfaciens]